MQYQSDYILRIVEQMGAVLREAFVRFRSGSDPDEPMELTHAAIGMVVDIDPHLFLQLAPQSMVSFVEIAGFDDRLVRKLVEALELEADIHDATGDIILSAVRREQAAALNEALDPSHAN